jgi:hypothetical protein
VAALGPLPGVSNTTPKSVNRDISNLVLLVWNYDAKSPYTQARVTEIIILITNLDPKVDRIRNSGNKMSDYRSGPVQAPGR